MEHIMETPISRDWLLGFIERNACFSIVIRKSMNNIGYQTHADFSIKLPLEEEKTLRIIKNFLGIGHIYKEKNNAVLKATKMEDIKRIANFLEKANFVSEKKNREFDIWLKCIKIMESGKHLSADGLLEIALLRDILHNKNQWNKKRFCQIRFDIDPCVVYQKENSLPANCFICWEERGIKREI